MAKELKKTEALNYLEYKLNITFPNSDWETEFKKDKWGELKKIYWSYLLNNYFQNIDLILNQTEPTKSSSIKLCLEGIGGVCIDNNFFLANLLTALGYGAYSARSSFIKENLPPNNHVFCVVPGDSPQELWAIDAGCCQIFHKLVPLHKIKEGQVFTFSSAGFEAQIRYDKENQIFQRVNIKGDFYRGFYDTEEYLLQIMSQEPRDHEYFKETMKQIFTDVDKSVFFQHGPVFCRYIELNEDGSFKFVLMWGLKYFLVSNDEVEKQSFESYEEMWPTVEKFFPLVEKRKYDRAAEIHLKYKRTDEVINI